MTTNDNKFDDLNSKLIDLELAKRDLKKSKVIKYLPAFVLVVSSYYWFLISIGLAIGYIGSKIFTKYLLENGKIDCIYIDCGNYKIHLHHWILGTMLLLLVWFIDFFYLPRLFVGVILGVIAHDIYDFNDWHKILVKKEVEIK
ncbi:MAG: hypothetical protein WCK10_02215 [Candidatus Staskawiczbacteria bacterium]